MALADPYQPPGQPPAPSRPPSSPLPRPLTGQTHTPLGLSRTPLEDTLAKLNLAEREEYCRQQGYDGYDPDTGTCRVRKAPGTPPGPTAQSRGSSRTGPRAPADLVRDPYLPREGGQTAQGAGRAAPSPGRLRATAAPSPSAGPSSPWDQSDWWQALSDADREYYVQNPELAYRAWVDEVVRDLGMAGDPALVNALLGAYNYLYQEYAVDVQRRGEKNLSFAEWLAGLLSSPSAQNYLDYLQGILANYYRQVAKERAASMQNPPVQSLANAPPDKGRLLDRPFTDWWLGRVRLPGRY